MYQNLHSHTKTSDGQLNYIQNLDACKKYNISVIAFTDHDAVPNEKAIKKLNGLKNHPTRWIIGCEISSGLPKEIGGPASNFHIVGLFVNPFNKNLKEHCKKAQEARIQRMKKIVKNLKSLGFNISEQDCLKQSAGETVGRVHIVEALKKKRKNLKIIENLRMKMKDKAKKDFKIQEKYKEMIKRGENQYPYSLFLEKKAFVPDIYVNYLYWKDMDQSVDLIRKAGGVAILAHWTFSKNIVNEKMIGKFFEQKRLDGAEIVFGGDSSSNLKYVKKDMEIMKKLTERHKVLQSGGIDSHAEKHLKWFSQQKWLAEKTIGMVEKMMKMRKLNLEFSSL